jgi:23S rRNA pseudouridine2605 synthase
VGRLDFNTSGLLLLTTSGDLANKLMHPSSMIEREYAVRIRGELSAAQAASLRAGIDLDDGPARIERIEAQGGGASNHWYHVVLYEGRYREVRRLFDAIGQPVGRLMRVRFGELRLPPRLRPGRFVELLPREIAQLTGAPRDAKQSPTSAPARHPPKNRPPSGRPQVARPDREGRREPGRGPRQGSLRSGKNR